MIPFAYVVGSMAGGMLASSGYEVGKEVILEMRGGAGIEAIMPAQVAEGVEIGKDAIADLKIQDKVSAFKDMAVSTTEKGMIKIQGNA